MKCDVEDRIVEHLCNCGIDVNESNGKKLTKTALKLNDEEFSLNFNTYAEYMSACLSICLCMCVRAIECVVNQ